MRWPSVVPLMVLVAGCARVNEPRAGLMPESWENPILARDTPDPCVVHHRGVWYTYSTSGCLPWGAMPIRSGDSLGELDRAGAVIPADGRPPWIGACDHWAPEVHRVGGRWIAYHAARNAAGRFCIGAAVSDSPAGPFEDVGAPLVEDADVGLIDPTQFRDPQSRRRFLVWKEDGNAVGRPTPIRMQELESDGLRLRGGAETLIVNDAAWEGEVVEGPSLMYREGWYYLFYSGNAFFDDRYGIGVARARDVWGPWEKDAGNPILASDDRFDGPGHCFLFEEDPGKWVMFYHARRRGEEGGKRYLMASRLEWDAEGWPRVEGGAAAESED